MRPGLQRKPFETGLKKRPAIQRRYRVNPNPKQTMRPRLIEWNRSRIELLRHVQQITFVADARESLAFFLVRREAREIIDRFGFQRQNVLANVGWERSLLQKHFPIVRTAAPKAAGHVRYQPVRSESLLVKKNRMAESFVYIWSITLFRQRRGITIRNSSISPRATGLTEMEIQSPTFRRSPESANRTKFIPFCVATKIVVIIENQNARFRILRAPKISCR